MKTRVELSVETGPETKAWGSAVRLADHRAFREIVSMGFEALDRSGEYEYQVARIELAPDDDRLRKVFDILRTVGMSVYERRVAPPELRRTHFAPLRFRTYEERDLAASEYLSIQWSTNPHDWQKGYIATSWRFREPVLHIGNDRCQRSKLPFGVSDSGNFWLCDMHLADALKDKALKGLQCVPAVIDGLRGPARKPLALIWSDLMMPDCLTPRQDLHTGQDFDPERSSASVWDDGGWAPPVLRFPRKEIEGLGAFDVALTRERTGEHQLQELHAPEVIVSQRFRQAMKEIGVSDVFYAPVELL